MEPPASPNEDIHTILNRFEAWSGKQPENGKEHRNGSGAGDVRELPLEEAMRQLRSRRTGARTTAAKRPADAPSAGAETNSAVGASIEPATVPVAHAVPTIRAAADPTLKVKTAGPSPTARTKAALPAQPGVAAVSVPVAVKAAALAPKAKTKAAVRARAKKPEARTAGPMKAESAPKKAAKPRQTPTEKAAKRPGAGVVAEKTRESGGPRFRDMLTRSLEHQSVRDPERQRRVSVRLSRKEEQQLQQYAEAAGLTVSAYLRQRALGKEFSAPPRSAQRLSSARSSGGEAASSAMLDASGSEAKSGSVLSGWLTLLRQRFLSSPARFAERA